jgi:primosomal protein N' (replication factor Y)
VVPEIPSFAVDDGFTYTIPDDMPVHVGSKVRIRVSGRRLAGYVTAVFAESSDRRLLPVDSVAGSAPLFDDHLLSICRWAAEHYVAPLSTILKRTSPPNAPSSLTERDPSSGEEATSETRGPGAATYRISAAPHTDTLVKLVADHRSESTLHIIVPTAIEAGMVSDALAEHWNDRVVAATSSMPGGEVTRAWRRAAHNPTTILVGTRETVLWKLAGGGRWIVVEDGRRVMKSPASPTLHVRDIVWRRSGGDDRASFVGPVPTLELLAAGVDVIGQSGRAWAAVDVIDRTEEPPGSPMIASKTRAAINRAVKDDNRVFVLVTARGYAPAFRCRSCAALRRCPSCQSTALIDDVCRRCSSTVGACAECGSAAFAPLGAGMGRIIDEVASFAGASNVGQSEDRRAITVGSERDLVGLGTIDLGVVVDIDGIAGAPNYRAAEDALRLCVRVAHHIRRGDRNRLIVQTSATMQPVVQALAAGKSGPFLSDELMARKSAGFPPHGQLIAIEVAGVDSGDADVILRDVVAPAATLRGPAPMRDRSRWLIQGPDLDPTRIGLRSAVGKLRSDGATVRVDADPVDL